MDNLAAILENLNREQLEAVEQIEGPVMVIAGPGTGKTQILSARIANILEKTDTDPGQILCLTYTEAGVSAMRKRLISMIGPVAFEVRIHTFHSLGANIIRENESLFGIRGLQIISELELEQFVRELIDELPASNPLKMGMKSPYYMTKDIKKLFSLIKQEAINVENMSTRISDYIKDMPEMEEYQYKRAYKDKKKGDPKEGEISKISERLVQLNEVLNLFPLFEQKMAQNGRYDYDDMLHWVIKLFEKEPVLLLKYQEEFLYILVDEFQDTNGVQLNLLYQLSSYWDSPNIFVVGDDDQSIYKFQGANVGNILDFDKRFSNHIHTTVLVNNYRSSQPILSASDALININHDRLVKQKEGLNKTLIASNPETGKINERPIISEYANSTSEAVDVSYKIKQLVDSGVKPEEIAVIYRNHFQSETISKFLMSKGIPVYTVKSVDILNENLIVELLLILEYINLESNTPFSGEHLLFQLLHFEFFNLEPLEIAKFVYDISKNKKSWRESISEKVKVKSAQNQLFEGQDFVTNLRKVHNDLEYWIGRVHNLTLSDLVEKVIAKGGFLSHALNSEDKNLNMQMLKTFFDFIKDETTRNPGITLNEFMKTISLMKELGIGLEVKRVFGTVKGVQLLTAHGSKGLEFDYVFIIGCTQSVWQKSESSLPMKMDLLYSTSNASVSTEEEARRLFYVALTRARKSLHISWFNEHENKSTNQAKFITELEESKTCDITKPEVKDDDTLSFITSQFTETDNSLIIHVEDNWLDKFIENYTLSVTHLSQYLKCPVSFYYEKVLRVPTAKSHFMGFGSAIHNTLDEWVKDAQKNPKGEYGDIEMLCKEFEKQMYFQRASFTDANYNQMLDYGKSALQSYYNRRIDHFKSIPEIRTEQRLNSVVEGIPINGMIDKIEIFGTKANLVDYKTGNPKNGLKKLNRPLPEATEEDDFEKRFGGDYWRQLVFYKLLTLNQFNISWKMESGEIDFIESDESETRHHKLEILDEDIHIVKNQIKEVITGIKNKQFKKGCGDAHCTWCNFEKYYLKNKRYNFEQLPEEVE